MSRSVSRRDDVYFDLPGLGTTKKQAAWRTGWSSDFVHPKPYVAEIGKVSSVLRSKPGAPLSYASRDGYTPLFLAASPSDARYQPLINKAFVKLREDVYEHNAELGVLMGEIPSTLRMITQRLSTVVKGARLLRKGRFREFLRFFRVKPKRRHLKKVTSTSAEFADLWLEYYFGWKPLIQDVYNGAATLSEPWSVEHDAKGRAKTISWHEQKALPIVHRTRAVVTRIRMGGRVQCVNPNVALATRCGLTNPLEIAWELIPFSFVVDWFARVGDFIGSLNPWAGFQWVFTYTTYTSRGPFTESWPSSFDGVNKLDSTFVERRLGLAKPLPNLEILTNLGNSQERALTAVSLVLQVLSGDVAEDWSRF